MGTMKQRMIPDFGTCFKESLRMKPIHQIIASTAAALAIALPLAANAANPLYLNAGAMVTSKINSTIDSGSAHAGDKFSMTVTSPYPSGNGEYASGLLYGHIVQAVSAGQGRNAVLTFAVDRLVLANGRQGNVNMMLQSQETQRHNNTGNIAMTAVADTALAGEPVADSCTQHRDARAGFTTLIGENDRDAEVHCDLRRDRA